MTTTDGMANAAHGKFSQKQLLTKMFRGGGGLVHGWQLHGRFQPYAD